jgi:hypothetical protein
MYALANIDFSDRLGFVVSELTPDEIDRQDPLALIPAATAMAELTPP